VYLTYLIGCRFLPPPPDGANPDIKIQWETVVAARSCFLGPPLGHGVADVVFLEGAALRDRTLPQDQRGCCTADAHEQSQGITCEWPPPLEASIFSSIVLRGPFSSCSESLLDRASDLLCPYKYRSSRRDSPLSR
jgi:hypothetical protein